MIPAQLRDAARAIALVRAADQGTDAVAALLGCPDAGSSFVHAAAFAAAIERMRDLLQILNTMEGAVVLSPADTSVVLGALADVASRRPDGEPGEAAATACSASTWPATPQRRPPGMLSAAAMRRDEPPVPFRGRHRGNWNGQRALASGDYR